MTEAAVKPHATRNLNLDLLRGLALMMVLVDHIESHADAGLISRWSLKEFGFSDGADLFVFLSGYVFGLVYYPRVYSYGLRKSGLHALYRSFQIYIVYLATVLVLLDIGYCFGHLSPLLKMRLALYRGGSECVCSSLVMAYQPYGIGILCFYALILPWMPLMLWFFSVHPILATVVSFSGYLYAQTFPYASLPSFPGEPVWNFNPLAWQFLFFLGLACYAVQPKKAELRSQNIRFTLASSVLLFSMALKLGWLESILSSFSISQISSWANVASNKSCLGPLRIVHFLSLAFVFSCLAPSSNSPVWRSKFLQPLVVCGQHSLHIYALGVVLLFVSIIVFDLYGSQAWLVLTIIVISMLSSITLAFSLHRLKK